MLNKKLLAFINASVGYCVGVIPIAILFFSSLEFVKA